MRGYVELHAHSYYSLLDGTSSPEALVQQAASLGMGALALTDHDAVYGAVRFAQAAKAAGIKPIFGVEMTLTSGGHLTLLVENADGWRNLCRLITIARHNAPKKGEALLPRSALEAHYSGLIALSGCRQGTIAQALLRGDETTAFAAGHFYRELFGRDNFWIELHNHLLPDDSSLLARQIALAAKLGIGVVATNNVHYASRDGHRLQDVLVCIREHRMLTTSEQLRRPNSEYYLKDYAHMAPLFTLCPEALINTHRIAQRCTFELGSGLQDLPVFPVPNRLTAADTIEQLCEAALPTRYPHSIQQARARLDYELGVITRAGLANYFLIVWDIVRYANERGIRCQGRGSAANSLVAYLLGITLVDPLRHDLVFERFLSDERQLPPDIDIDFDAARREEVIQYVYDRYGRNHAAMACTFVTFRARSAVREVGKVLSLSPDLIGCAAKALDTYSAKALVDSVSLRDEFGDDIDSVQWRLLFDLCAQIHRLPRHLGIHNGGMVITGPPLVDTVPTEPATMPDRTVVQWDKNGLEDGGLVKIDILGLRMLSAISDAVDAIAKVTGQRPDIEHMPFDDPAVFQMIRDADTIGLFQIESNAQTQLQPRLKARTFEDLIISVSLIRPGPIQGNMVHPYLRRRDGIEKVVYPHPLLEDVLKETLGVIIYQEQVLKVTHALTTLTIGQGELLRRALGSDLDGDFLEKLRTPFIEGAIAKGVTEEIASEVFDMLLAFGGYAFPKSHAAAFSVLVYQSAWLKRYHPAAFFCGLLNHQPMGFWRPSVLVNDARRHGVDVLAVDLNVSAAQCMLEGGDIRLGLESVHGIGNVEGDRIIMARGERVFRNLKGFCQRTGLPKRKVENLILAGAFDDWDVPRRQQLWQLGTLRYTEDELPLVFAGDAIDLPPLSAAETMQMETAMMGLSTGPHMMTFYRDWLNEHRVLTAEGLQAASDGAVVQVAGVVVMHQAPPTAKGMRFITLEDETGLLSLVIRPDVYERLRRVVRGASMLVAGGVVQHESAAVSLLVREVWRLTGLSR